VFDLEGPFSRRASSSRPAAHPRPSTIRPGARAVTARCRVTVSRIGAGIFEPAGARGANDFRRDGAADEPVATAARHAGPLAPPGRNGPDGSPEGPALTAVALERRNLPGQAQREGVGVVGRRIEMHERRRLPWRERTIRIGVYERRAILVGSLTAATELQTLLGYQDRACRAAPQRSWRPSPPGGASTRDALG
jgi:hypothetical protein